MLPTDEHGRIKLSIDNQPPSQKRAGWPQDAKSHPHRIMPWNFTATSCLILFVDDNSGSLQITQRPVRPISLGQQITIISQRYTANGKITTIVCSTQQHTIFVSAPLFPSDPATHYGSVFHMHTSPGEHGYCATHTTQYYGCRRKPSAVFPELTSL